MQNVSLLRKLRPAPELELFDGKIADDGGNIVENEWELWPLRMGRTNEGAGDSHQDGGYRSEFLPM